DHVLRSMPSLRAFPSWCCVFLDTPMSSLHLHAYFRTSGAHSISRRNSVLTFVWHSLSCSAQLSVGKQSRCSSEQGTYASPLQPCLCRGGNGCIRTRPKNRLVARVRAHSAYYGSGRPASHLTLAAAPRRLRLRPDAQ